MDGGARLANHAWEALLRAHAALMKEFAAEEIWRDLSMREYDVLYTLSKCPKPIRLVARGLVRRAPDPGDGRGVLLSLTEAGQAQQRRIGRLHARSVAEAMTRSLTPDQLTQLESLCARLADRPATPEALTNREDHGL